MMRRREFITLISGAAAWPLAARGQQGERMRRIGVLIAGLTENDSEGKLRMAAFREGLQNLGWIEGRNVHIEERWPGGNAERLRSFAAELAGMQPDAIFAGNEAATMALHQTAGTLPIVFAQVADPVANGLVASPARPGGNANRICPLGIRLCRQMGGAAQGNSAAHSPRRGHFRSCKCHAAAAPGP